MATEKIPVRVLGAILATGLLSFSGVIVETAMNITFPTLMREFGVSISTVQWMTTGYLLVVATIVPLSAALKRTFPMRGLFVTAVSLFLGGVLMDAFAPAFAVLLLGRAVQGLGTGIALPLMFNIILEQVPRSKIGTWMGLGTMITGVAPAIGPTFGGLVVETLGWRYIFYFLVPVLVAALFLGLRTIRQSGALTHPPIDALSVVAIGGTFAGFILGLSNVGTAAFLSPSVGGAFIVGIVSLAFFIWRSRRIDTPVVNLAPFGNVSFSRHVLAFVGFQMLPLGMSFLLPNYIQLVNHSSALVAGLIVLPGSAVGAAMAPISGKVYDRFGGRLPILTGITIALGALIGMIVAGPVLANPAVVVFYTLFMFGVGMSFGNIMTDTLAQLSGPVQSDGNAILNTLQQFAAAIGTAGAAAILAAGQAGASTIATGTARGVWWAYLVFAGIAAAILALMAVTVRSKKSA